jgi:hypothetical protein
MFADLRHLSALRTRPSVTASDSDSSSVTASDRSASSGSTPGVCFLVNGTSSTLESAVDISVSVLALVTGTAGFSSISIGIASCLTGGSTTISLTGSATAMTGLGITVCSRA